MRENNKHTQLTELLELHYGQLELIVFQHGVKPREMEHLMKDILHSIIKRLQLSPEISLSQSDLIDETLAAINGSGLFIEDINELEDHQEKRLFHFEEDEALHLMISQLDPQEKSALILCHFHHFETAEIARLVSLTEEEVQSLLDESTTKLKEQLDVDSDGQVAKLLSLLKKSYDRVKNLTNWESLIGNTPALNETGISQTEKKRSDKFSVWKPVLLISVIMIFFGSIIFVGETYGKVDDRYLAKIEEDYENEKVEMIETLQIKPEALEQLHFVQETDHSFESLMLRLRKKLEKGEEVTREEIKEDFDELLDSLLLPSEMVEKVIKEPLIDDKHQSEVFFSTYLMRLEEIKHAYYVSLYDQTLPYDQRSNQLDVPEKMAEAMEKQNLKTIEFDEVESFPTYHANEQTEKLRNSIHPDTRTNVMILENQDIIWSLNKDFDPEKIISTLSVFEKEILKAEPYSELYHRLTGVYTRIIMWSVQDGWRNQEDPIFGEDGTVKTAYRDLWTNFANSGDGSPLTALFKPVVTEMEETGWAFSEKQEYFGYENVDRAITLAREGRLDEFTFEHTDYPVHVDPYITEIYVDSGSYQSSVRTQYNDFIKTMDPNYIGENDPLSILGVYELARTERNVEAVYNLTYKTMPFDEFKEQWEPGTSLFEGVESIKMDPNLVENVPGERPKASVVFSVNGKEEVRVKMVHVNYTWLVSEVLN